MGSRRLIVFASAVIVLASCSGSTGSVTKQINIAGGTAAGTFEAVIRYPSATRAGKMVGFPMTFRNTGGRLASFQFDIAVDGPPGCAIQNMMAWPDVSSDLRPGAVAAAIRYNKLPHSTDLRELGLWPESGFDLDSGMVTRTTRTFLFPGACHGNVGFVAVARPYGRAPIARRFQITVAACCSV